MKFTRKLFCALLLVLAFSSSAFARHKLGMITLSNTSAEDFGILILGASDMPKNDLFGNLEPPTFVFYDTFNDLNDALKRGDIDEIVYPELIADFIIKYFPDYEVQCIRRNDSGNFAFAFLKNKEGLRDEFNEALRILRGDMTLTGLANRYYRVPNASASDVIEFEKFEGAETIKVAVTGDNPPLDMFSSDGKPIGFNVAVLSKIGKLLKKNIELVSINSGERVSALKSGKADVIFGCLSFNSPLLWSVDIPDDIIASDPYFSWNNLLHVGLKKSR